MSAPRGLTRDPLGSGRCQAPNQVRDPLLVDRDREVLQQRNVLGEVTAVERRQPALRSR